MVWIFTILAASGLLAWLLVALRRYEHESAVAALDEVEQLRETIDALTLRVQNLEAIAAEERLKGPDEIIVPPKEGDSLSSDFTPRIRS